MRRAYVRLLATAPDGELWNIMDAAAFSLAARLGQSSENIQYWNAPAGRWDEEQPLPGDVGGAFWRDALGTTHHEAGTLFMGDAGSSITDSNGKFHHLRNVYAV